MEPTYSQNANVNTRVKTMQEDLISLPKNLKQAFESNESIGWKEAADLELGTLTEMGVFDHRYTRSELLAAGVTKEPINISVVLTNKYTDGVFDRHKVHMTVAGHKSRFWVEKPAWKRRKKMSLF